MVGKSITINLSKIPEAGYYDQLLERDFTYDKNTTLKKAARKKYLQQTRAFEELLHDRSVSLNAHIVDAVEAFVSRSLDLDKKRLFTPNDQMYGATLVLDMQISDHELILATIEKRLRNLKRTNLCVQRLQSKMMRKKSIAELLEPVRQFKRILIMIEQAEILTRGLTEAFVGHLRNQLSDDLSPTETIMVVFCLSARVQVLPFDQMNCFGRVEDIVKNPDAALDKLKWDLMESRGMFYKIGPRVLDCICEYMINVDASIASARYLYSYAVFLQYHRLEKSLDSREQQSEMLEVKHQSLINQLDCYAKLLKDYDSWPEDISSIYELFNDFNHISESVQFVDSIKKLEQLPQDVLLRKIARAVNETKIESNDVSEILSSYQDRIINNKDCSKIITKMTNELLRHGERIENLIKSYKFLYCNDSEALKSHCITSARGFEKTINCFADTSTYFGIVFSQLMQSTGYVMGNQIFEDVMDDFIQLIRSERKSKTKHKLSEEEEMGLAKALFFDVIDCLEHQQIVMSDKRTKLIRKLAWPTIR